MAEAGPYLNASHAHDDARDHSHAHEHGLGVDRSADRRALHYAFFITSGFMLAEAVGGWFSGSLALLADAGHMLTDSAALALSLIAVWLSRKPTTRQRTYGLYRAEILATLVNGLSLFVICGFIFYEAWERFHRPRPIQGGVMLAVAVLGLIANLVTLNILWRSGGETLNLRGAMLHVMGDLLGSIGAIGAAAVVLATGWTLADPLISVLISLLIVAGAMSLLSETVRVLLEIAPAHIKTEEVEQALRELPGVAEVHDVHVWTISSGIDAVSGHLRLTDDEVNAQRLEELFRRAEDALRRFKIAHITLQVEPFNHRHPPCQL